MSDQETAQKPTLPPYPEMIMAAIEALSDPNGSNKTTISRQIESVQPTLPPSHAALLSFHLNQMKQSGQLVMAKNNYMKPDPNAPPKRGRGRPPKPKDPAAQESQTTTPRPRGRPPKVKSSGTGRPRGRPPKKAKTDASSASQAAAPATGERRGRGRPPKVKPVIEPVGC